MARHANIPIFIPHLGCPNACVFCNQRTISGVEGFSAEEVIPKIDAALETLSEEDEVELAFFGGSFTGIDRGLMISLLEIAKSYIDRGKIGAVRCSTRPDYIDGEILDILVKYGVKTVELGLQSRSESVLSLCRRGHSATDEQIACRLIRERGLSLVGQMMIGLPGSTVYDEEETARFIVSVGAVGARIYPTVVFRDTELAAMTDSGEYAPLSLNEAVERSFRALKILEEGGVRVIRVGLCSSENLTSADKYVAGPNHPAIGEMVMSRMFYERIREALLSFSLSSRRIIIYVPVGCVSKAVGQDRANKKKLMNEFNLRSLKVKECDRLTGYGVEIREEGVPECT